jgi:hypothetical protein
MKLIFTLSAGRTGTAYLAELMRRNVADAEVHHEILTYSSFGVDSPDISQLHTFNNAGNTPYVQEFWRRKLDKIFACGKPCYVETSHILMKAGLVENIASMAGQHEVHFIILERDKAQTAISFLQRGDFMNKGNMWLWLLEPGYSRNMVAFAPPLLLPLWYLYEIEARAHYYKKHYSHYPHMHFHTTTVDDLNTKENIAAFYDQLGIAVDKENIVIPPKQNISVGKFTLNEQDKIHLKQRIQHIQEHPEVIQRRTEW